MFIQNFARNPVLVNNRLSAASYRTQTLASNLAKSRRNHCSMGCKAGFSGGSCLATASSPGAQASHAGCGIALQGDAIAPLERHTPTGSTGYADPASRLLSVNVLRARTR